MSYLLRPKICTNYRFLACSFTHNDLKYDNVWLSDDGNGIVATIIDLGLMKPISTERVTPFAVGYAGACDINVPKQREEWRVLPCVHYVCHADNEDKLWQPRRRGSSHQVHKSSTETRPSRAAHPGSVGGAVGGNSWGCIEARFSEWWYALSKVRICICNIYEVKWINCNCD